MYEIESNKKWAFLHLWENVLGPYKYLYTQVNLWFDHELQGRGSEFFPIKSSYNDNTEIFLETPHIVIGIARRGSLRGKIKTYIDIVNIQSYQKFRFSPDEISLIYNTQDTLVICYKKRGVWYQKSLDIHTLDELSTNNLEIAAYFKLLFDTTHNRFNYLIYKNIPNGEKNADIGYFEEIELPPYLRNKLVNSKPYEFHSDTLRLDIAHKKSMLVETVDLLSLLEHHS